MRVFCDANTLLSSALFPTGRVASVFTLLIEQKHEVLTSDYVLDEVRAVVARKFPTKIEDAELFVTIFHNNGLTWGRLTRQSLTRPRCETRRTGRCFALLVRQGPTCS